MKRRTVRIYNTDENPIEVDPNTGLPIEDKPTLDSYGARWVDVESEGPKLTDRQKFDRQEAADAKAKWDSTVGPALAENLRLRQEMKREWDAKLKAFYSHRPAHELLSAPNVLSDASIVLPLRGGTPRNKAAEIDASNEWANSLEDRGYNLNNAGKTRVALFAAACSECDCDMNLKSSWDICMERLRELDVFGDELTLNQNYRAPRAPAPAPAPAPEVDILESIENAPTSEARELVLRGVQGQAKAWFDAFFSYVVRTWNYYLTDKEVQAIVRILEQRNLSFLSADNWDLARRTAVRLGQVNPALLTEDEKLGDLIQNTHDMSPWEEKRAIALALQKMQ